MTKTPKKTCLLIAGMHRSGTSALTRVLSLLGADLPKTLMGGNETNETGHWESVEFMKLNDEILNSAGSSWNDWTQCTPGWFESKKSEEFIDAAKTVFYDEFGTSRLMVMKDPRNCRILPFWLKVLDDDNIETKIILPVRSPIEVAASHHKRDGIHKQYGMLLWLRHVLDAELFSRGRPRLFSTYNQLMGNWSGIVDRIESELEVIWSRRSAKAIDEIENYISPKYRHHENSDTNLLKNSTIPAAIRDTYAIMLRWSESGEDSKDFATLDQIRKDFDNAAPMFATLVSRAAFADNEITNLNNSINELNQHIGGLNGDITHRDNLLNEKAVEAEALKQAIAQLTQEKDALGAHIAGLDGIIIEKSNEGEALKQAIAELAQQKNDMAININSLNEIAAEKNSEIEELSIQISKSEHNNNILSNENKKFVEIVEAKNIELFNLGQEVATLAEANQEYENSIHLLNSSMRQKDAEIEDRINDLEKLAEERKLLESEVNDLSQLLDNANSDIKSLKNEHENLQKIIAQERNGKQELQSRISNISAQLENSEKGKQEIIKRLIVVQQNLDQTQAAEEIATNAKLNLIEQITHEERPYFSLKRSSTKRKANLLRNAGVVDEEWYINEYPDVAATGMNATLHYVKHGKAEGRKPRK